jgi:penicillin-binding protein 1C
MKYKKTAYSAIIAILCIGLAAVIPPAASRLDNSRMRSWRILDDRGVLLREVLSDEEGRGSWIPLREMGPDMAAAIVAVEDKRFYHHPGIDLVAISRAAWLNFRNQEVLSGGSTLTQQLARQMYRLPRRWYYKPAEALLAVRLELWLSKEEILEQYLNRAPFGNQLFGVEAASRAYFQQPARQLSLAEAAFLAGLPQSPTRYNPYTNLARAQHRQSAVLAAMLREGIISADRYRSASAQSVEITPRQTIFAAPHFCQMVLDQIRNTAGVEHEIHTTLDSRLQTRIERLVDGHIAQLARNHVTNAAVLVIENRSRAVKAWVGSRDFFNELHHGQVDGVRSLRQPGSAIKPFTYVLALENGFTAASILADLESNTGKEEGGAVVHNYDEKYHGPVRLRTALACSYNVATVRLLEALGVDLLLERLQLAGLSSLQKPAAFYGPGLTLGNGEVTLRDLTTAYAALAGGGLLRPVHFLTGQPIAGPRAAGGADDEEEWAGVRIFSRAATFIITDILADPRARAPAFGLGGPLNLPFPCAAKTGTTKDFRDNWTVGYTTEYTVGVWVGNFDGQPMEKVSGITGAAPLFRDIMLELHPKADPAPFTIPPGVVQAPICPVSGQHPTSICPGTLDEWFIAGTEPRAECKVHREVAIDRRNGLVATAATPRNARQMKIYEVWPPEYRAWMAANTMPVPPEEYAPAPERSAVKLAVASPAEGDIFRIDPILRPEYQTILLEAVVPDEFREVEWMSDERVLASVRTPFQLRWSLEPGIHHFRVRARNESEWLYSRPVTVQVF